MKYSGMLLAVVLTLPAQAADQNFQKIINCMRASVPLTIRADNFEIEATDKAGATRVLKGKLFAKRDKDRMRVMLQISEPSHVAGASYLVLEQANTREDDMYVFLPSVHRVRHVTGAFANGSLLGTDFSYAEVKQISNAFSGAGGKLEGSDTIDGLAVDFITLNPAKAQNSPYSSVKAWVDRKSCLVLRADFYAGETLRKRLTVPVESLKQSGKYWYLSQMDMQDIKEGSHTTLRVGGVQSGKEISSNSFNPSTFYVGN